MLSNIRHGLILARSQVSRPLLLPDAPEYERVQSFISHAEGDLECAIALCEIRQQSICTLSVLCYLLHQALEKWLKAYLEISELPAANTHSLDWLLRGCGKEFEATLGLLDDKYETVLDKGFPANIRYEMAWSFDQLLDFAEVLTQALVRVRQQVIAYFG